MNRKFQEDFLCSQQEIQAALAKVLAQLFSRKLAVEGQNVNIPKDAELEYKLKYDEDEEGGSFTIKVTWENFVEETESEDY